MRNYNLLRASVLGDGVYSNLLVSKIRVAQTRNFQKIIIAKYAGFLDILLRLSKRNYMLKPGLSFAFALQFIQSEKGDVI